jgi:hypothetical protein
MQRFIGGVVETEQCDYFEFENLYFWKTFGGYQICMFSGINVVVS